ncbi:MAG: efflux transporter periplasmic adaptor subunit [Parachlamydiales bacterium]|nr:efflux transporter periplasmic adaptor subunit [Parachlamydiales bacterium]
MKNRTIEIPFSRVSLLRVLIAAILLGLILYWALAIRPYLSICNAHLAAPYLEIRADQVGRVAFAPYEEGASVKQGDVLFSLNTPDEKEQQKHLEQTVASLEEMLSYHLLAVEQAMQEYITARSEAEMGLIPSEKSEQPLAVLQEHQSGANECKQQLACAQMTLEKNRQLMQQRSFSAPFSGVIVKRQKREGDVVQLGDAIYSFCDPGRIWVDAIVPEKYIAKVSVGQKASVRLPASRSRDWAGEISWISPVALPTGEGIPIRISLPKTDEPSLRPNLTAEVKIKIH